MVDVDPRRVAEEMAGNAAEYIMLAPQAERDEVLQSCVTAFREALADVGVTVSDSDAAHYIKLVTNAVEDMQRREAPSPGKPV